MNGLPDFTTAQSQDWETPLMLKDKMMDAKIVVAHKLLCLMPFLLDACSGSGLC